jgi:hypothetical protein
MVRFLGGRINGALTLVYTYRPIPDIAHFKYLDSYNMRMSRLGRYLH